MGHFVIDEPSALFRPGCGAAIVYANDSMRHQLVRVTHQRHVMPGIFRVWRLKGRPYMAVVLRNVEPGHYLAQWAFWRLALDLLVLPGRVTQVDWRAIDHDALEWDRMVLPATLAPDEPIEDSDASVAVAAVLQLPAPLNA